MRNKIHLIKLSDIDRTFKKETLDKTFDVARDLFKIVEDTLGGLT